MTEISAPAHHGSRLPDSTPRTLRLQAPARAGAPTLYGRDELLAAARTALHPSAGLLFTGPDGIGRTALLDALAREAAADGSRILRCAPGPDDAALPHAALIDLLGPLPDGAHAHLPEYQHEALRSALLRGSRPGDGLDRLALRLAVAATLERTATTGPVLLVLDGIEHLDRASADVLAHVARHAPDLGVALAAARRTGPGADSGPDAGPDAAPDPLPPGAVELVVPALPDEAVAALLADGGHPPEPAALRRLLRLAAGNPGYARELARELARESARESTRAAARHTGRPEPAPADHGADRLEPPDAADPDDLPLPPGLRARLLRSAADLPPAARRALLLTATAARPSLGLLLAAGVVEPVADLAEAERRGLVRIAADGGLRLDHPLLAAALRADARAGERLAAHADLARAVTEPVERARHLALAHPYEDQRVAGALAEAAAAARRHGSADTAYRLAVLAVARTPAADSEDRHQRLLAAAAHAADAGRHDDARRAADRVLAETPDAASRVRARLALLETAGQALDDSGTLIEGGFADAQGDPALQARLHFWSAVRELLGGRTAGAAAEASRAVALAEQAASAPAPGTAARPGGPPADQPAELTRVDALGLLATVQSMRGRPNAADGALAAALRLAGPAASASLLRRRALADLDADRVAEARRRIAALADRGVATGAIQESLATLVAQVRIQARAGDCARAVATADRCTRLLDGAGMPSPLAHYAAALAETVGGSVPHAVALARTAVDGCAADGDRLFEIRALGVLGGAHLLTGEVHGAVEAAEALQRARELGAAMELADPDTVRRLADLAEALVLLGDHGEAQRVLAEAAGITAVWPRAWGEGALAALDRSAGLLLAALGRTEAAVESLRGSAERLRTVALPLDLARTLVSWAAVERRARRRSVARSVLAEAEQLCLAQEAYPLLARVRQERDRVDPGERVGGTTELTPSERRVAELVAGGATNREVAAVLCVSVKTVEGTLSRVYRKLGVRSRTGLVRADTHGHSGFTSVARVTPLIEGSRSF
ncbi:AAA family ATPase [Streptacidiphilus sp. PB12-B1b]|uniref:helix-turn-helix transcriptional regulator n=1 Tax=Streptacidiphilus sp. PB12-B1b TaxID=2705012 RepID=UPI0015FA13D0|nr:LuxR family transcriptional regulator [Streptacidiphilus sp. PB12-B1b]QMU77517.1 AAA family ATPase [Streptacidiphilus sp. PB12-B1b]